MKIDLPLTGDVGMAADTARRASAAGADGVFTYEGPADVMFPLVLAADAASHLDVYTNVAVGLPRNAMHLAYAAWDLQRLSGGRFALGLGSQIRRHVVDRFGAPWEQPVAQLEELVAALRAIFACWHDGTPLDFDGRWNRHTYLPPTFLPKPIDAPPPVWLAALGPRMTTMAGRVADALVTHPMCSVEFVRERTLVALEAGADGAGRDSAPALVAGVIVGAYSSAAEQAAAETGVRGLLGFYCSTPAYRPVLDHHGWGELQPALRDLTRAARWDELADAMPDEVVATLSLCGDAASVGSALSARYGDIAERIAVSLPYAVTDETLAALTAAVRR